MMNHRRLFGLKAVIWVACLVPFLRLGYLGLTGGLGANPIEFITLSTGTWTLVLLLSTLAITPLRIITRQNRLVKFRRLVGLFAFFYGCLHFLTYVWLDQFFDFPAMLRDVGKRPFITMGLTAFSLLVPLAATSTTRAIRWLGGRRWQWLHRLIYVSAIAAVIHFWWKVKADVRKPEIFAAALALLLGFRIIFWARGKFLAAPKRKLQGGESTPRTVGLTGSS
jgi:sulfoxide reductase heme-binding subunit YedZ